MTVPSSSSAALARAVDPTVIRSIRQASQTSNADFGLLMAQAERESGFRTDAKSASSSASGLFQFVDSTWLGMVHRFGAKYGIGELAQQISETGGGKLVVSDAATRRKILDLRQDPALSAGLAGEYAKMNQATLEQAIGRPLSRGDIYMAHFLGAGGASTFLKTLSSRGDTPAASVLPDAASANPSIFYDASGHAKSVGEIYREVAGKIEEAADAYGGSASMPSSSASALAMGAPSTPFTQGHVDWSGVKLSTQLLQMLDVVAMAALKMSDDNAATGHAPAALRASAPHTTHSL